jgi:DNA processing protein
MNLPGWSERGLEIAARIAGDLVVEKNQWAKALVGRPGIHPVSGLREAMEAIDALISEEILVEAELRRLVPA